MIFRWLSQILSSRNDLDPDLGASVELEEAKRRASVYCKSAVALELQVGAPVRDDPHSSIGGSPSLPSGDVWPEEGGRPMLFLLQINYADMPHLAGFPQSGLLSVFVQDEDIFGCEFPSSNQKGFRSIYYPDPTGFGRVPQPLASDMHPYGTELEKKGCPLVGVAKVGGLTPGCHLAHEIGGDLDQADGDAFFDWLADQRPGGVYYGGHPDFVQYDIRKPDDDPALSEVVLQQSFVTGQERQWGICWGDAGEMSLLIGADDLSALCFKKTVYNWDCS